MRSFHLFLKPWSFAALLGPTCLFLTSTCLAATVTTVATLSVPADGTNPAALIECQGAYYGTTSGEEDLEGGNPSTIFRLDIKTGVEEIVHTFTGDSDGSEPYGPLHVIDGKIYGTTIGGGANKGGVVFSFDPATNIEAVVANLPANTYPKSGVVALGGLLYGTGQGSERGSGSLFSVDPVSGATTLLHDFPPSAGFSVNPGPLLEHNGSLFGTTAPLGTGKEGVVFRFDPATGRLGIEHRFGASGDGGSPNPTLVGYKGLIYGTTSSGTIFSLDPVGHSETVLHTIAGTLYAGLLNVGGVLYGVTSDESSNHGTIFSFDTQTAQFQVLHDFSILESARTFAPLIDAHGVLLGVTLDGGPSYYGYAYSFDPATGQFNILHDFHGSGYAQPSSGLTRLASGFYGVGSGGSNGVGLIFKVVLKNGTATEVYSFRGGDGQNPSGDLLDVAGILYGVTRSGGANDQGTVFSFDPRNGRLTTLHAFDYTGGEQPQTGLVLVGNKAYGTTAFGGQGGTVYSLDLSTLQVSTVAEFDGTNGYYPSSLTLMNGLLYGTAQEGGANQNGTIFVLDPATGKITAPYSFLGGRDGSYPLAGLRAYGGLLYGSTSSARHAPATVFSFDPATGTKTTLRNMKKDTSISTALTVKGDKLFGTFLGGEELGAPDGGLFRVNPANGNVMLFPFANAPGPGYYSTLLPVGDALLGTTAADNVFKFVP